MNPTFSETTKGVGQTSYQTLTNQVTDLTTWTTNDLEEAFKRWADKRYDLILHQENAGTSEKTAISIQIEQIEDLLDAKEAELQKRMHEATYCAKNSQALVALINSTTIMYMPTKYATRQIVLQERPTVAGTNTQMEYLCWQVNAEKAQDLCANAVKYQPGWAMHHALWTQQLAVFWQTELLKELKGRIGELTCAAIARFQIPIGPQRTKPSCIVLIAQGHENWQDQLKLLIEESENESK